MGFGVGSACDDHVVGLGSVSKECMRILKEQALFGLRKNEGREGEEFLIAIVIVRP